MVGQHSRSGGSARVYDDDVRAELLESVFQQVSVDEPNSRHFYAVRFRHDRSLETYSTPLLYSTFAAVPFGGYESSIRGYWMLAIGATVIGMLGCCAALRMQVPGLFLTAAVLTWFNPLLIDLNVANVNQVQFGMLGILLLLLLRRTPPTDFVAAFWLGLCLAFKPSLVFCAAMIPALSMIRRDWSRVTRWLTGFAASAVVGLAFSAVWFPVTAWFEWMRAVRSMPDEIITVTMGNYSATRMLQDWTASALPFSLSAAALLTVVTIGTAWFTECRPTLPGSIGFASTRQRRMTVQDDALALALGCQIFLLSSKLVWYHYLVLSLPAVLVGLKFAVDQRRLTERLVLGCAVLWSVLLIGVAPIDSWLASSAEEHRLRCVMGNVLLFALLLMRFTARSDVVSGGQTMSSATPASPHQSTASKTPGR